MKLFVKLAVIVLFAALFSVLYMESIPERIESQTDQYFDFDCGNYVSIIKSPWRLMHEQKIKRHPLTALLYRPIYAVAGRMDATGAVTTAAGLIIFGIWAIRMRRSLFMILGAITFIGLSMSIWWSAGVLEARAAIFFGLAFFLLGLSVKSPILQGVYTLPLLFASPGYFWFLPIGAIAQIQRSVGLGSLKRAGIYIATALVLLAAIYSVFLATGIKCGPVDTFLCHRHDTKKADFFTTKYFEWKYMCRSQHGLASAFLILPDDHWINPRRIALASTSLVCRYWRYWYGAVFMIIAAVCAVLTLPRAIMYRGKYLLPLVVWFFLSALFWLYLCPYQAAPFFVGLPLAVAAWMVVYSTDAIAVLLYLAAIMMAIGNYKVILSVCSIN